MTRSPALTAAIPDAAAPDAATPAAIPDAWLPVCALADLAVERGAVALVDGEQVALFRLLDDTVLAVQQHEPHTQAMVMSRGIVGTRGGRPVVTSPLYKQVFDLSSGECLDTTKGERVALMTWQVEVRDGVVHLGAAHDPGARAAA
ncbi:nitrite reductase small subunit NirD [Sanguibacter hominis ATCC BAA-789]|uniref:Nitrite reductase small subunit NirD n=1 Tax=Sanguibacter hominis ATCC BAA-789 TaxID=1312740 RepID=A0A9X5FCE6_9MICO|nr:nitrite reductase small subunit NirD [Sanguibacter hominis]NKX93911.1 nitrite reductase small subunit NirD [Sanguibacter hominis ATCC BAA-789]